MDGPADTVEKIIELLNDKEKLAQYRYGRGGHSYIYKEVCTEHACRNRKKVRFLRNN
jgi:hypothetical protein